jgi:hypothetical protein
VKKYAMLTDAYVKITALTAVKYDTALTVACGKIAAKKVLS